MRIFAPITKIDQEQRMVFGYASTEALDRQGEIIRKEAVEAALPDYMRFANIREMHQPSAVGVAKTAEMDERGLYLAVKVVDDAAWAKVREGVYTGFSIGGQVTKRDTAQKHVVTGCTIAEISLVDRPANPEAVFEMFKAGARNSKADLDRIQGIHDQAVSLGAVCRGCVDDAERASDGGASDDGAGDDLGKRLGKAEAVIADQAGLIDALRGRIAALGERAAPPRGALRAIGKPEDVGEASAASEADLIKADPLYLIKQAQRRPIPILR
jgi:phage head maturation protease